MLSKLNQGNQNNNNNMLVCVCVCVSGLPTLPTSCLCCQHFICMKARVNVNYEHQTRLPSPKSPSLPAQGPPIPSHVRPSSLKRCLLHFWQPAEASNVCCACSCPCRAEVFPFMFSIFSLSCHNFWHSLLL